MEMLRAIDGGVTYEHCLRVAGFSVSLAGRLELGSPWMAYEAGLYHDIGKIAIPAPVLLKPGPLDQAERELIELHAEEGERLLEALGKPLLAIIIGEHHESIDGSGYPRGRSGSELSLLGQIVGVADMYDALTQERPYRATLSRFQAMDVIREMVGHRFWPAVVSALEELVEAEEPIEPLVRVAAALAATRSIPMEVT